MNKYTDRLSLRTLRVSSAAIRLGGWVSMICVAIMSLQSGLRPVSEMPWYFWVLALFYYLGIFYTPPAEIVTDTAWLQFVAAVSSMAITIFTLIFLPLTGISVLLLGFSLAYAKRSIQLLLRQRQQSTRLSASR